MTVDGAAVSLLRTALTDGRYAWALNAPDPWHGKLPDSVRNSAHIALNGSLTTTLRLQNLIHARGVSELGVFQCDPHPAVLDRIRLCFSPGLRFDWREPWLPVEIVRTYLDGCADQVH